MPANKEVPEKDPRREAGAEICALIDGRAPKNDAQKDALYQIHRDAGTRRQDKQITLPTKPPPP